MDKLIVASAQQQMRLFESPDGYRRELIRFLNMARAKGARLIVFPPLSGVMAGSHAVEGFRVRLLKQASERQRGARSLWSRTRTAVAEGTAALLGASYRRTYAAVLQAESSRLGDAYVDLFADLARTFEITVVAGSAYLEGGDGSEDGLRHRVIVFGPDGARLGEQDKVILSREDEEVAAPGGGWRAIDTPAGRLGILFEQEALYPEIGRMLAYDRAEILITLAAVGSEVLAAYVRHAVLAQAQANRCFAMSSFLVGRNYLAAEEGSAAAFTGKSGIYAPLEMTPRYGGVLVEMGTADSEGLVTAELDRERLAYLWEHGTPPVRKVMPVSLFAATLSQAYDSGRTLDTAWREPPLPLLSLPAPTDLTPEGVAEEGAEPEEMLRPSSDEGAPPLTGDEMETPPAGPEAFEERNVLPDGTRDAGEQAAQEG